MKASKEDLKALEHKLAEAKSAFDGLAEALHRAKTEHVILQVKHAKAVTGKDIGDYINTVGGRGKIDSIRECKYFKRDIVFNVYLTKKNGDPYKVTRSFFLDEILPDEG